MALWPTWSMDKMVTLVLLVVLLRTGQTHRCQSCFSGCRTFDDCDCEGADTTTCEAPYCYAKLEYFTDDGVSAIQKGCVNDVSTSFLGCQYASDDRSIACFCSGDLCNTAVNLTSYETPELPLVTCCECNDDESGNEICFPHNCTRNCTGNFCYLDMVANAQGCGWGHPQLFHFLRSQKYRRWEKELTCAEYYDNYRNYMHGCTCSGEMCNVVENLEQLSTRRRSLVEEKKTHFCHSLYAQSDSAFGAEIYRHASLCASHYCFMSWTSVEVISDSNDEDEDTVGVESMADGGSGEEYYYGKRHSLGFSSSKLPRLRSNYEISAGCLLVDDEEKVQVGCTIEWSQDERAPLTKHCICSDRLCNGHHLIDDSDPSNPPTEPQRPPFRSGSLSSLEPTPTEAPTISISPQTTTDPTMMGDDQTFVPVTSAFGTSALNEPNSLAGSSTGNPVTTTMPPRPPQGHYRVGGSSSGASTRTLNLVVCICTLLSISCTAIF